MEANAAAAPPRRRDSRGLTARLCGGIFSLPLPESLYTEARVVFCFCFFPFAPFSLFLFYNHKPL